MSIMGHAIDISRFGVFAIDPGTTKSAWVVYDGVELLAFGKCDNSQILDEIASNSHDLSHCAIEWIQSYGRPVGREVFETCRWVGVFQKAWDEDYEAFPDLVTRMEVKRRLFEGQTNWNRMKDADIRKRLMEMWGGPAASVGTKDNQGPLYGVTADVWSALAVAVTWWRSDHGK